MSKVRSIGNSIELKLIQPIYKTKLVRVPGEEVPIEVDVLLKEVRVRKWFAKDSISSVEEYIGSKQVVCKSRCVVFDRYSGKFYAVDHSAEDVQFHVFEPDYTSNIGFRPSGSQIPHKPNKNVISIQTGKARVSKSRGR